MTVIVRLFLFFVMLLVGACPHPGQHLIRKSWINKAENKRYLTRSRTERKENPYLLAGKPDTMVFLCELSADSRKFPAVLSGIRFLRC
jgi:hypothetical protein